MNKTELLIINLHYIINIICASIPPPSTYEPSIGPDSPREKPPLREGPTGHPRG